MVTKKISYFFIKILILSLGNSLSAIAQNTAEAEWNWFQDLQSEIKNQDTETLLSMKETALQEAVDVERRDIQSKLSKELAFVHLMKTNELEVAMEYLIRALEIDDLKQNQEPIIYTNIGLSLLFEKVNDFNISIEYLEKASVIVRNNQFTPIRIYINQKLGKAYTETKASGKALEQYENILAFSKAQRMPQLEAEAHADIARIYHLEKDYDKALSAYQKALAIYRRLGISLQEAECLHEIGLLYHEQKETDEALENYKAALYLLQNTAEWIPIKATLYNSIAANYLSINNAERALANLRIANLAAQESQNQPIILNTYDLLSKAYKILGNYQAAFEYIELKQALENFIQEEKNDREILKKQSKNSISQQQKLIDNLEFKKIQQENELEQQKKSQQILVIIIVLIAIILILILSLFIILSRNNKKLKVANEKVRAQNIELQDLNATKDKFFSIISHDLKGPLNSLTSFSGLLMNHTESLSTEEIQMLATDLDKSIKNLFTLLENLLEWSRSQTGNIEFVAEKFNLTELLNKNKKLLEQQAGNKNISIEVKNSKDIMVTSHPNSINTVIRNLLSNSIKFTNEGGQIKMGIIEEAKQYVVKVADNGVGMPKEVAQKIFRIDTKHSTSGTAKEKGTGLGLILCKEFVEKNGGKIWVKSEEGRGTIFSFSLPKA